MDPHGKYYPRALREWKDWPGLRQHFFEQVSGYLQDIRVFPSLDQIKRIGERIAKRKIASKGDLLYYMRLGVEDMVTDIIYHLCKDDNARRELRLGRGVVFNDYSNSLSTAEPEVRQGLLKQMALHSVSSLKMLGFSSMLIGSCRTWRLTLIIMVCTKTWTVNRSYCFLPSID